MNSIPYLTIKFVRIISKGKYEENFYLENYLNIFSIFINYNI